MLFFVVLLTEIASLIFLLLNSFWNYIASQLFHVARPVLQAVPLFLSKEPTFILKAQNAHFVAPFSECSALIIVTFISGLFPNYAQSHDELFAMRSDASITVTVTV